jgi:hypothetical protein
LNQESICSKPAHEESVEKVVDKVVEKVEKVAERVESEIKVKPHSVLVQEVPLVLVSPTKKRTS